MPGVIVDGFDFFAVHEAAGEAVARARDGGGPTLIEVKFTRYFGHFEGDQQPYRADEVARRAREPATASSASGPASPRPGQLTDAQLDEIDAEVGRLIDEAVADAKAAPEAGRGRPAHRRLRLVLNRPSEDERHMARSISYREAINEALAQEMERDASVIVMGEDNAGGQGSPGEEDAWGGVLGVTKGLYHKFPGRVLDTPISESAFIGAAIGAATGGLRPVAELMFIDFMGVCFDQIFNQAAKFRYMFGGKAVTPVVVRTMCGAGLRAAAQHCAVAATRCSRTSPGSRWSRRRTPYDAKGLLIQSIRDDDPVIFCEHKMLYDVVGRRAGGELRDPVRRGQHRARGRRRHDRRDRAHGARWRRTRPPSWRRRGVECEIIDPRTISPLDTDTILESVENTGRLVVVDEANPRCSLATDIAATVAQDAFGSLRAPIQMVTGPHTPVPFADSLEDLFIPDAAKIAGAVKTVVEAMPDERHRIAG